MREFKKTQPANGTLTQEFAGDPFTYTPNPGFVGTDSFQVQSFDEFGFGSDAGTVTIDVTSLPRRCRPAAGRWRRSAGPAAATRSRGRPAGTSS